MTGCFHTDPIGKAWLMPDKPESYPVQFEKTENGAILNKESTVNLAKNMNELKAYQEKLEVLVQEMLNYYTK